jgi:hypothetical protein
MKNKLILFGFTVLLISGVIGCGDANMGYVRGKVLIDGKPVRKNLVVIFQPQNKDGSPSYGVTDDSGNYELYFSTTKKGVQLGVCKITLEHKRNEDEPPEKPLPFLSSFNKNTPLVYEVKRGKQTYDVVIDTSKIPPEKSNKKPRR